MLYCGFWWSGLLFSFCMSFLLRKVEDVMTISKSQSLTSVSIKDCTLRVPNKTTTLFLVWAIINAIFTAHQTWMHWHIHLRMSAYAMEQQVCCHRNFCELSWVLCKHYVQAVVCRTPTCCPDAWSTDDCPLKNTIKHHASSWHSRGWVVTQTSSNYPNYCWPHPPNLWFAPTVSQHMPSFSPHFSWEFFKKEGLVRGKTPDIFASPPSQILDPDSD